MNSKMIERLATIEAQINDLKNEFAILNQIANAPVKSEAELAIDFVNETNEYLKKGNLVYSIYKLKSNCSVWFSDNGKELELKVKFSENLKKISEKYKDTLIVCIPHTFKRGIDKTGENFIKVHGKFVTLEEFDKLPLAQKYREYFGVQTNSSLDLLAKGHFYAKYNAIIPKYKVCAAIHRILDKEKAIEAQELALANLKCKLEDDKNNLKLMQK